MQRLPILEKSEEEENITIESFNLSKISKGEITFECKKENEKKSKKSKETINLFKLLPDKHMHHIPAADLVRYFQDVQRIEKKNLSSDEVKRYHESVKRFLRACASKIDRDIVAAAHGLLAHLLTLHKKYDTGNHNKKPKKILVLYMNNPERWGETQRIDLDMYSLSKVITEKKRAMGHDVTLANLTSPEDIPALLEKLGKKKFSDVCLVGHSLRYNYDDFEAPFDMKPPLQHPACHHIGGFTVEDCADLLYKLSTNHGVTTVKSFACESGIMAKKEDIYNDEKYDDQGEVPHDLDLLSDEPSIIQLTLAHVALFAQMDENQKKLNLVAVAPNGIAYIAANNDFKFRIIDPKDYFQKKFVARNDRTPRTENRLFDLPETDPETLHQRAEHAREKLQHKLTTLNEKLGQEKDSEVLRLLKREIKSLERILTSREPEKTMRHSSPK